MLEEILKNYRTNKVADTKRPLQVNMDVSGRGALSSCFKTTDLAAYSMMIAAKSLVEFANTIGATLSKIEIDRRLAALWFGQSIYPQGWQLPPVWDDIAGDYKTVDGWIRLHTNADHHKRAALSVLDCRNDQESVRQAIQQLHAKELETAILQAGGCAAEMHSLKEWKEHPQGQAISKEPLVIWEGHGLVRKMDISNNNDNPLKSIKILDLTRVIAGPVATRFLAAYGADVLRIDPVNLWDDSVNAPEMSLGKRCAGLDLKTRTGQDVFTHLLSEADVLVHGYRPGALENLGFGEQRCSQINNNLNIVSLCAYGWSGPWSGRRGFDSLVQMSSGIADAGMRWKNTDKPQPLPVQALDHATGYFMAAAILTALKEKAESGRVLSAKLSLAKTADFLTTFPTMNSETILQEATESDLSADREHTAWGLAKRLKFPVNIQGCKANWRYPATQLRTSKPQWGE